jgi:hypothetical protein
MLECTMTLSQGISVANPFFGKTIIVQVHQADQVCKVINALAYD